MRAVKLSNLAQIFLTSILLCSISFTAHAEPTATRALKIIATDPVTKQTGEVTLYNKSVAVIIGIDQYEHLPADRQLSYAVKDAKGIADVLKRQYKFDQIITLYNKDATRKAITKLLEVDLPKQLGKEDALFIFWAGHGNQESSSEGDIGYLIPHDGSVDDITSNLTMSEIRDTVSKKIPAKHIFYVMDACYSGLLTESRSVDKTPRRDLAYLQDMTKERVRQVLTAGGKGQEVLDGGNNGHSVFTGRLIELLEKTGDFITANEIQAIIKEKVNGDARARNHQQTPSYGTLYGSGDFVFIPSLEQKVADNKAEIAKLEAELKALDANAAASKLATTKAEADQARRALEGKLKAEQLKKDQLAADEKRRADEAAERQRLLAAKSEDDKRLGELKAVADARRKANPNQVAGDFPTVDAAVTEIKRLNEQINSIQARYENELTQTRLQVKQRYGEQLAAVNNTHRDEFESAAEFKAKQDKQRADLNTQRDGELARLSVAEVAAAEVNPLRASIKTLAEREYVVGEESITAELGAYSVEAQQFPITLNSKSPNIKLAMNGNIPLPVADAKAFKQQWLAKLVRPEIKVTSGAVRTLALANDADNSRYLWNGRSFMTAAALQVLVAQEERDRQLKAQQERERQELARLERERQELARLERDRQDKIRQEISYRGEMVAIPGKNYEMGKYEITQAQWRAIMGSIPEQRACSDNCPVVKVSWNDIQEYLQKLNAKTGRQYRLPTETEWQYACYGGSQTKFCGGNDMDAVAWHYSNGHSTQPVGQKQANGYGLHDMSGNVAEIMKDYGSDGHGREALILRGGSWNGNSEYVVCATCLGVFYSPNEKGASIGFRIARTLP